MAIAGISWGIYSIRGRGVAEPFVDTLRSFLWSSPLAILVSLATVRSISLSSEGIVLAFVSGAVTSGLGYVAWYAALKGLTATRAAIVQLAVPALAAVAGVVFLSEEVTIRLLLSAVLILGGVALALKGMATPLPANPPGSSS
jgi:drug/metabolite transporter (DMT)-like permease